MVTKDDVQAQVDEARGRMDGLTGGLKDRVPDAVKDRIPDAVGDASALDALGALLVAVGLVAIVVGLLRRRVLAGVLGGGLVAAGAATMGSSAYKRRSEKISETEDAVRDQLSELDPIARAQILKDLAVEQAEALKKHVKADN